MSSTWQKRRVSEARPGRCGIATDVMLEDRVHQLAEQDGVVLEGFSRGLVLVPLPKPPKLQRIMFAIRPDIIRNEIIVSDSISLLRMVPEPTRILNPLTVVVD